MIRWMCGVEVTERLTCSELRERLGIDDIISNTATEVKMVWTCFKQEGQHPLTGQRAPPISGGT